MGFIQSILCPFKAIWFVEHQLCAVKRFFEENRFCRIVCTREVFSGLNPIEDIFVCKFLRSPTQFNKA